MNAIVRVNAGRRLSPGGLAFIKAFEWCVLYPYDDKVAPVRGVYRRWQPGTPVLGTLTVLYGHTDAAAHPLKIADCIGKTFDEAFACEVLDVDLDPCEAAVRRMVTVYLTQGEFDACVSFIFNCGEENFANIARRLNAGDYAGARAAFDLYVLSKGERMAGLQRRRDGEQAEWDLPDAPSIAPIELPRMRPAMPAPIALPPRPEILEGEIPSTLMPPPAEIGRAGDLVSAAPKTIEPAPPPAVSPIALPTEPVHHSADVDPDHGLDTSRTVRGAGAAAAAGMGITVDQATELAGQVQEAQYHINTGTVLGLIVGLIIVAGAAYAVFARWDRGGRPLPAFTPAWLRNALK